MAAGAIRRRLKQGETMSDLYVRTDVRLFLDYYNTLPGPRAQALKLILKEAAR
jgi:hypothetical protein